MSVASVDAGGGNLSVGDVLSRAWKVLTGNLLFFLLVPVIIYVAMVAAFVVFGLAIAFGGWASSSSGLIGVGIALAIMITLSLTMIGQGVLLLGAFQRLRGQPLRVGEVLKRVIARVMPLLGLSILWALA